MTVVIVRPAREEDLDAIGGMWARLVTYHRALDPRLPPAHAEGPRYYARQIADRMDDPSMRVLVAEVEGQRVGYVLGMIVDLVGDLFVQDACGFLADIYVEDAQRRSGIGRRLVEDLVSWFGERGVSYYEWHVAARNDGGRAFWSAMQGQPVLMRMRADVRASRS